MKRPVIAIIAFYFLTFVKGTAQAQKPDAANPASTASTPNADADKQAELNRQLIAEIKQLRLELLRQRIEFQQWKLRQVERELQTAQAEQQRLAEEEQATQHALAELGNTSDGSGEIESLKKELTGSRSEKLRARRQGANQRAADLTTQLNQEDEQLRQLTLRLKAEIGGTGR
ncbi:MAG: hypothetical protein AAB401_09335 [Acidobacteriota bacterium]